MKSREVFGKKIGQFQYWQFRLAERAIQIESARNLYLKATFRLDQGVEFPEQKQPEQNTLAQNVREIWREILFRYLVVTVIRGY